MMVQRPWLWACRQYLKLLNTSSLWRCKPPETFAMPTSASAQSSPFNLSCPRQNNNRSLQRQMLNTAIHQLGFPLQVSFFSHVILPIKISLGHLTQNVKGISCTVTKVEKYKKGNYTIKVQERCLYTVKEKYKKVNYKIKETSTGK